MFRRPAAEILPAEKRGPRRAGGLPGACRRFSAIAKSSLPTRRAIMTGCSMCVMYLITFTMALVADDKPDPPKIALAAPFVISVNATTKVILRGWKLNREIVATTTVADVMLKVVKHDNAPVPGGQDAKQIGDTLVELDVTLPQGFSATAVPIILSAGDQATSPLTLLVGGTHPVISEVEPNDGFRQAQKIAVPQIVDGQIHADRDIDVFSIELAEPQSLRIEVFAHRHGSALDSLLTIFDARGIKVASNDDAESVDSKIETLLSAGEYFIVLQDAHDHGGQTHPYRLVVEFAGSKE